MQDISEKAKDIEDSSRYDIGSRMSIETAHSSVHAVLEPIKTLVLRYNTSVSNLCSEVKTCERIKLLL